MAKTYCLAIEVKSEHIEGGLGYLIAFQNTQNNPQPPEQSPDFGAWSQKMRDVVRDAGDAPFNPDPYTRKVAIAELMYEIEKANAAFSFKIEGNAAIPAVQVQSTNPHDKRIWINFADEDGQIEVVEKKSLQLVPCKISEDGKISVIDGKTRAFPFAPVLDGAGNMPPLRPTHTPRPNPPRF